MKVSFRLSRRKPKKGDKFDKSLRTIEAVYSHSGQETTLTTGIKVPIQAWSQEKQKVLDISRF